ncbi:MAG: glycoside hydrolase family 38, partial [Verrucomicrobiota bacterium]
RAFLDDRGARLKLVLPAGGSAEYSVPGGTVRREPCGEVPGGRWVRAGAGEQAVGFASDALYGFDTKADEFRATIARASRYASDVKRAPDEQPWQPCADLGEHRFRALLTPDLDALPHLADALEEPPVVLTVPAHLPASGSMSVPTGSLLSFDNKGLRLLALSPAAVGNALELRLQNASSAPLPPSSFGIRWLGRSLTLPRSTPLAPGEIATWRLTPDFAGGLPLATPSALSV